MDDSLSYGSLFAGAKKFAFSAWTSHNRHSGDRELFLLHAGVSIERLAKATLAKQSPILLMETNAKEDLLLYFAGAVPSVETRIRTIGASVAISRLRKLGVLRPKDTDLDGLIELRNGVAHLAADTSEEFDPVLTFARTTTELLRHLGEAPGDYWGRMTSLANVVLSEASSQVEREVAIQIRGARHRFEERFLGLQADAMETYRAAAKGILPTLRQLDDDVYFSQSRRCPGCRCPGILDAKVLPLKEGSKEEIFFEVLVLSCKHCDLVIEGREQLVAAEVEYAFSLPLESMQRRQLFHHLTREDTPSGIEVSLAAHLFKGP
ncbi:hypothetical protein ACFZAM_33460 [Streptomyces sp. NPDC008079]|uniref:hypothetical protein n=1 Tax=Streptomyces sp. NPDC008079 TaxID=3364806 RepID=UPI0036E0114D